MVLNARHTQRHSRKPATVYVVISYLATAISQLTIYTDAILQAYRFLGLVLRLANFEPNEIALGISGTAVVSLSSLQFQVSHNTNPNPTAHPHFTHSHFPQLMMANLSWS